jgi:peroxiredoxin Q/BCP
MPSTSLAADLDLPVSDGTRLTREALSGRRVVLYFYPKDDTPGCTLEGREFSALRAQFEAQGVAVYGVSPDSERSHERFITKCELGVPLVSDPDRILCEAYGVWKERRMYGRTYMGVERSTFLVEDGEVVREWRGVKPAGHAAEVLAAVGA